MLAPKVCVSAGRREHFCVSLSRKDFEQKKGPREHFGLKSCSGTPREIGREEKYRMKTREFRGSRSQSLIGIETGLDRRKRRTQNAQAILHSGSRDEAQCPRRRGGRGGASSVSVNFTSLPLLS